MSDQEKIESLRNEYNRLMHAIQTAIGFEMNFDNTIANPKHLRVGIDSNFISNLAIANLLLSKGIITSVEYYEAQVQAAAQELERHQAFVDEKYGEGKIGFH